MSISGLSVCSSWTPSDEFVLGLPVLRVESSMAACCCSDVIHDFTVRCCSYIVLCTEDHWLFNGLFYVCPVYLFCGFYMIIRDKGYANAFIMGFRRQSSTFI